MKVYIAGQITGNKYYREDFRPPVFAWCMRRKAEILADSKKGCDE